MVASIGLSRDLPRSAGGSARPALLARWLMGMAWLVVAMVIVGGITRLTESGLSITEWKPITGAIPPLNEAQWQAEFDLYKQIPEYTQVTGPAGMTLADFKFIYFWEWAHRFLGRLLGLAFALPLAWFWVKSYIPTGYKHRLLALLALGGMQGAFGWFMVRSGLSGEMTDVSHFWLSIHLLTALFTLAGLVWTALDLRMLARNPAAKPAKLKGFAIGVSAVLFIQLLLGAWVAGLNAGLASDTWPLMQERFIPEYNNSRGFFYAATHDPFLLHWLHRWWAVAALIALVVFARRIRPIQRLASVALHSVLGTQILLGIATVMTGVALWLGVAHQAVGALLVMCTAWGAHLLGRKV
ncbi:COX15/CtaA family protein [Sphingomonadaceae bacterium]|nr:COX15/CtaA family protein [Sphingomonadaceae bacterium]